MKFPKFFSEIGARTWRSPLVFGAIWVPTLTVFVLSFDPAITTDLGFVARTAFWVLHVVLLLPVLMVLQSWIDNLFVARQIPPLGLLAITAVVASVVFAPVSIMLELIFEPAPDLAPNPSVLAVIVDEFLSLVVPTLCIWLLVNGARIQALSVPVMTGDTDENAAGAAVECVGSDDVTGKLRSAIEQAFWSKVPRNLGRDLVSLTAEQHYLHVSTTKGRCLILFPIGRAVEALDRYDGVRIHRSYWVVRTHILDVDLSGGRMEVVLSNGERLPVSRRNRGLLKSSRFSDDHE